LPGHDLTGKLNCLGTFTIQKRRGTPITIEEARTVLETYGPLNKVEYVHPQFQVLFGNSVVVVVEFATFDLNRDLQAVSCDLSLAGAEHLHSPKTFRHHSDYKVDAFDSKKHIQTTRDEIDEAWLSQYEIDRQSIFVGGIPVETTEAQLNALFSDMGIIKSLEIIRKPAGQPGTFTFQMTSQI
jgi:polyadenylate-binding protein